MPNRRFRPGRLRRAAVAVVLLVAGCAPAAAPPATVAPIPAGEARIWFYRVFFPGDTIDTPAIALNGQTVGRAIPGQRFYRDVPPGFYHVTVETVGRDTGQAQNVSLAPGQNQVFAIQSSPNWVRFGGRFQHGTYYVRTVPDRIAAQQLAGTRLGTGY